MHFGVWCNWEHASYVLHVLRSLIIFIPAHVVFHVLMHWVVVLYSWVHHSHAIILLLIVLLGIIKGILLIRPRPEIVTLLSSLKLKTVLKVAYVQAAWLLGCIWQPKNTGDFSSQMTLVFVKFITLVGWSVKKIIVIFLATSAS